jgi:hypothetical protein
MMQWLLINEPYAAGKSSVMVTVNDIYSMGGRPIGMVNVLASGDDEQRRQIVAGIEKGCRKLRVPMLGGHLHPDADIDNPALSVAIVGLAKRLMRSHLANPGDNIVLAVDLDGRVGCRSVVSWDANSGKSAKTLLSRLEALPVIAEAGLAHAAKDISNAGIMGTISIMMENSGKGAVIDIDSIPLPEELNFTNWVLCFQSYGFVLAVHPDKTDDVLGVFREKNIEAGVVGRVTEDPRVIMRREKEEITLFDFEKEAITGIRFSP